MRTPAWRYQLTSFVVETLMLLHKWLLLALHWVSVHGYQGLDRDEYLAAHKRAFRAGQALGAEFQIDWDKATRAVEQGLHKPPAGRAPR